jgi:hypothetical protein
MDSTVTIRLAICAHQSWLPLKASDTIFKKNFFLNHIYKKCFNLIVNISPSNLLRFGIILYYDYTRMLC